MFCVKETYLELSPNEEVPITISVYLTNKGRARDIVNFKIKNGQQMRYLLEAQGVGTSILCTPQIVPELNLGQIFTLEYFKMKVNFANKGRRGHKMTWSRSKLLKSTKDSAPIS